MRLSISFLVIDLEKPRVLVNEVILVRLVLIKPILSAFSIFTSSSYSSLSRRGPRNPYPAPSSALWFSNRCKPIVPGVLPDLIILCSSSPILWLIVWAILFGLPLVRLGSSSLFILVVSSALTYLLSTCRLVLFFRCSSFSSSSLISVSNLSLILFRISYSTAGIWFSLGTNSGALALEIFCSIDADRFSPSSNSSTSTIGCWKLTNFYEVLRGDYEPLFALFFFSLILIPLSFWGLLINYEAFYLFELFMFFSALTALALNTFS